MMWNFEQTKNEIYLRQGPKTCDGLKRSKKKLLIFFNCGNWELKINYPWILTPVHWINLEK